MHHRIKIAAAAAAMAIASQAMAQVTFYEREGFGGRSFTASERIANLERAGFNDRASSAQVTGALWEVCEDPRFDGRCAILRPGRYPSFAAMGLNDRVSSVRAVKRDARLDDERYAPAPAIAQVTFYEEDNFRGRSFTSLQPVRNFNRFGFNDSASSVEVLGERWEACEDRQFRGRCVILRPGRYASLQAMGLNDRVSSTREIDAGARVDERQYAPAPAPLYDARRRNQEKLFEADVTSVRAVVGAPEQRCWIEREQVAQEQSRSNVPAAIVGAVIGGILGHQVGGGRGKDLATVGGVIAGGAVGATIGRDGQPQAAATRDVQRCETQASNARPEYWDVTYVFQGQEHRVQMTEPPGRTVTVNRNGEPRA